MIRTPFNPWVAAAPAVLWLLAFIVSCRLPAEHAARGVASAAHILLGDGRAVLGRRLYETADRYFHRGVPHRRDRAHTGGWIDRTRRAIAPEEHVHTAGGETAEVLPWLDLALRADPHNLDAALVAAYWLTHELDRPEAALQVLLEARRHNPTRHEVYFEQGRLLLSMDRHDSAARAFDAGLRIWERSADREDEQAHFDRDLLWLYRGLLHEFQGDPEQAAAAYRNTGTRFPAHGLADRAAALAAGLEPRPPIAALLRNVHREMDAARRPECGDPHPHEEHHPHKGDPVPVRHGPATPCPCCGPPHSH